MYRIYIHSVVQGINIYQKEVDFEWTETKYKLAKTKVVRFCTRFYFLKSYINSQMWFVRETDVVLFFALFEASMQKMLVQAYILAFPPIAIAYFLINSIIMIYSIFTFRIINFHQTRFYLVTQLKSDYLGNVFQYLSSLFFPLFFASSLGWQDFRNYTYIGMAITVVLVSCCRISLLKMC